MTEPSPIELPVYIPVDDFLEQHTPIEIDELTSSGPEELPTSNVNADPAGQPIPSADEADLLEQAVPTPIPAELDYPYVAPETDEA